MDDLEQKLNSILGNPEMMSQLMNMAQSMGQESSKEIAQPVSAPSLPDLGGIDMEMIQKIASFAGRSHVDSNQQALLNALIPYLSQTRIQKLQNAMRAARIAGIATQVLGGQNSLFHFGG